jgi:hypothetical protein
MLLHHQRMNLVIFMALTLSVVEGAAQDKPKADASSKQMPEALKSKFFKAQAAYERAQIESEQVKADVSASTTALQEAVQDVSKWCGDGKTFALDKSNDPVCVDAPKLTQPEKK